MPENLTVRKQLLVLGNGYVGKAVFSAGSEQQDVVVTSRAGSSDATGTPEHPLLFDLKRKETWVVVASFDFILWTFPAARNFEDVDLALDFFETMGLANKSVMVLGSTSCFLNKTPGELVNEDYPLDFNQPRVVAEESLRQKSAFVLCLAGIYGPGRDPCQWLLRGLIKNSESYINLIHVADIVRIVQRWRAGYSCKGQRLAASDGRHRKWKEVLDQLKERNILPSDCEPFGPVGGEAPQSKRVSNEKLSREIFAGPFHMYPEDEL